MSLLDMTGANAGMDPVEVFIIRGSTGNAFFKNGRFTKDSGNKDKKNVTLQALNPDEIKYITGGQRISDTRKFYLNDGTVISPENGDKIEIDGDLWSVVIADNRPWHNYCKAIIVKNDTKKG